MKLKLEDINTRETYQLTVTKGNKKPIPSYVWCISMQSATNCYCRHEGLCPIASDCYGLAYESNPVFKEATLNCRNEDERTIDWLVNYELGVEDLVSELLRRDRLARKNTLQYLRWNITGDLKSLKYLEFVDRVAYELYTQGGGIVSVIYTHNKAVVEEFEAVRSPHSKQYLHILGSGFMADANFDCFAEGDCLECSSDCVECFKVHKVGLCYNTNFQGVTIKETFRPSTTNKGGE